MNYARLTAGLLIIGGTGCVAHASHMSFLALAGLIIYGWGWGLLGTEKGKKELFA